MSQAVIDAVQKAFTLAKQRLNDKRAALRELELRAAPLRKEIENEQALADELDRELCRLTNP